MSRCISSSTSSSLKLVSQRSFSAPAASIAPCLQSCRQTMSRSSDWTLLHDAHHVYLRVIFIVCPQGTMAIDVVLVRLQQPLTLEQNTEYLNHHGLSHLLRHLMHGQRDEAWKKRSFQLQQPTMKLSTFFVTFFRHCTSLRRWRCG